MTDIKIYHHDPRIEVHFEKCPNLEVFELMFLGMPSLRKVPALCSMSNLSKLILGHVSIGPESLDAFEGLAALTILVFNHCLIKCDWKLFGSALANAPIKSVVFRNIDCRVGDIESFLESLKLDYFYLCNFTPVRKLEEAIALFQDFANVFDSKRENPSKAFLIEQDGYARNHNGMVMKQTVS